MGTIDDITKRLLGAFNGEEQKIESAEDQSQDEKDLVAFVRNKIDDSRQNGTRVASEGIWLTNIAYLLGYDVYYDTQSRQYRPVNNSNGRVLRNRLRCNRILPTIHNRQARLYQNAPKYDVRPEGNSSEDKDAARLSLEVINDVWDKQKIDLKRFQMLMWTQECGYSFLKASWDSMLGKPQFDPTTNECVGYEGEIRIDPVSSFEIFQDPMAKTLEDCQYLIQAKVRKLDYFRSHYPERGELVKEEDAWLISAQYEQRINSMSASGMMFSNTSEQMKNAAIECAYYERRSLKHPNGRLVVVANGVLLQDGELPVGEIPFVKFDDIVIGGKFMSESLITHLRPIQDQINRTIAKRAEWLNTLLAGKYLAQKGHGLIKEAFTDNSAEILEANDIEKIRPVDIPQLPQWAYLEEERLIAMFDNIAGIGEISQGRLPSAGIPAIGMQFLQEQDETRLGVITSQHEEAYAQLGTLILKYTQKFVKVPRLLKIAGSGLKYTIKNFMGADIKNSNDVLVIKGSTLPRSKVLRRQEIINAMSQGILGNPQDPKLQAKILRAMEWGDLAEIWTDQAMVDQQISEQVEQIKLGIEPPVHELDKHDEFVRQLNEIRISDTYKSMKPEARAILEKVLEEHLNWIIKLNNPGLDQQGELAQNMQMASSQISPEQIQGQIEQNESTISPHITPPPA